MIQATTLTLRLPKPGLQYVILCDASYHGTGFVLMVEYYEKTEEVKTYAPVLFGSRLFNTGQLKFSIYYKEFLALYFALDHFSHYIWGSAKPVIVLTDNRSLTQFFQAKTIPPSVWNFLDRELSFNIIIAHIPGTANYAADLLSRMQTESSASLSLKLTDKIPVREIYIDSTAQIPDASLNLIAEAFSEREQVDEALIANLQRLGLCQAYLDKQIGGDNTGTLEPKSLILFKRPLINAIEYPDPAETHIELDSKNEPIDRKKEQDQDSNIGEVKKWVKANEITGSDVC